LLPPGRQQWSIGALPGRDSTGPDAGRERPTRAVAADPRRGRRPAPWPPTRGLRLVEREPLLHAKMHADLATT
jgi:hypothetical protein